MDFIKKAGESLKGSSSGQPAAGNNGAAPQQGGAPAGQTQDYGDKGTFFHLSHLPLSTSTYISPALHISLSISLHLTAYLTHAFHIQTPRYS